MTEIDREWFSFLSPHEFGRLLQLLSGASLDVMPHQVAVKLGVDIGKATLVVSVLTAKQISKTFLLIYHTCENEIHVGSMEFGKGFPALPWFCPNCEEEVNSYSDLNFDFISKL